MKATVGFSYTGAGLQRGEEGGGGREVSDAFQLNFYRVRRVSPRAGPVLNVL